MLRFFEKSLLQYKQNIERELRDAQYGTEEYMQLLDKLDDVDVALEDIKQLSKHSELFKIQLYYLMMSPIVIFSFFLLAYGAYAVTQIKF